jgi:uncharacterized protein YndB with AHSA1/START domain
MQELGRLDHASDGEGWQLRFVRRFAHPPEKVWRAVTEPTHLRVWFPARIDGRLEPGGELRFVHEHHEAETLSGRVLEYEPPHVLEYTWGEDVLRFELEPDGDGTRLTFRIGFDELGRAARDGAGWHACLELLGSEVDGTAAPGDPIELWSEVHPRYVEALGPEAATIGPPEGHPAADR